MRQAATAAIKELDQLKATATALRSALESERYARDKAVHDAVLFASG